MTFSPEVGETFSRISRSLDPPMFIATTAVGEERSGCLIGFATQSSIDPLRFLACLSDKNHTTRLAVRAAGLALHVVPREAAWLAELFGSQTGDEVDKFAHCRWHDGPLGLPLLDDCSQWFAGRILQRLPLGDHIGHQVELCAAGCRDATDAFTLQQALDLEPGHEA